MKKVVLASMLLLLVSVSMVQAEEAAKEPGLHGAFDVTFGSKYIWRGFDVFDDHTAIHPSVDLDLFGTGFGVNTTGHRANSSGFESIERWDTTLYYQNRAFADECYAVNYRFGYMYYEYPDRSCHDTSDTINLQELHAIFSMPKVLGVEGLVPTYVLVKLWPSSSGSFVGVHSPAGGSASGFAHIFMLDYALPVTCPITKKDLTFNLHSEIVYNDGVSPNGATDVDHDWSNGVVGINTVLDLGNNLFLTPGMYYQSSWDDSVNTEDEFWGTLSLTYKF